MTTLEARDYLILNALAYLDEFRNPLMVSVLEGKSIWTIAQLIDLEKITDDNMPAEMNRQEVEALLATIQANPEIYQALTLVDLDNSDVVSSNQEQRVVNMALSYQEDLVVVFKGTAGAKEWLDNGESAYIEVLETQQQAKALAYFDQVSQTYPGRKLYVTGHSKGGNKAQHVTVMRGHKIQQTFSFDGQGFSRAYLLKNHEAIEAHKNKIISISNEYDFVNILFKQITPHQIYLRSQSNFGTTDDWLAKLKHAIGGWHSPYSMFIWQGNQLVLSAETQQSGLMQKLEGLFDYMERFAQEADYRFLAAWIMALLMGEDADFYGGHKDRLMPAGFAQRMSQHLLGWIDQNGYGEEIQVLNLLLRRVTGLDPLRMVQAGQPIISYSYRTRDFSDSVRDQLLVIVDQVQAEPIWDIVHWDIWYRLETLMGGHSKDLLLYGEGINEHYRKMIDMENMTRTKIQQIFQRVHDLDGHFGNLASNHQEQLADLSKRVVNMVAAFMWEVK